jgi:hypothetical protein
VESGEDQCVGVDKRGNKIAWCWWLTPVILPTQEAEIRRIKVKSQPGQTVCQTLSLKTLSQKIGVVEWLQVKALSSSPSTTNKKKQKTLNLSSIHSFFFF